MRSGRAQRMAVITVAAVCSTSSTSSSAVSTAAGPRPHAVFCITSFGAVGDNDHDDSAAVAAAFAAAAAAAAAGSAVTVLVPGPAAVYRVTAQLQFSASNAALVIEPGAALRWHWDKALGFAADWGQNGSHGTTMLRFTSGENLTVTGGGLLDGQGFMWWPFRYHVREYIDGQRWPPYFVQIGATEGLTVSNVTILDPPMITIETCGTQHAVFEHLNITASWLTPSEFYDPVARSPAFAAWRAVAPVSPAGVGKNGTCGGGGRVWHDRPDDPRCEPPNTDGIDPGCGSRDIRIADVFIENGDDSVVMKPGWPSPLQLPPAGCTRDVLVERVTIFRGMGANIGGMGDGCVDNITFKDLVIDHPSLMGAEIKTENGKDNRSFVSNVLYHNVTFRRSLNASGFPCVQVTAAYSGDGHGYIGEHLPRISNVTYRDVDARGCSTPISVMCNASQPCTGFVFDGIDTDVPFRCAHVDCTARRVSGSAAAACCRGGDPPAAARPPAV